MQDIIHVGSTYKNLKKRHNYKDVKYDDSGWADVSKYLPGDFDLCYLKTETKIIPGWHTNNSWDGKRVKENEKVSFGQSFEGIELLYGTPRVSRDWRLDAASCPTSCATR